MFNKFIKYGLYALVFLVPVFFLPATIMPTIINKQMLLTVFAFLLLVLWMLDVMISGQLKLNWSKISSSVLLLIAVLGLSTFLSGARMQSLWGMNFEPDTFYSFALYAIVFFLASNLLEKGEVLKILSSFLLSAGLLSLMFLIQALGVSIFPWDFAKGIGFNPIGSVQSLGVFLGGALAVLITLINNQVFSKKIVKCLGCALAVLLFLIVFLMNYRVVWLGISLSAAVVLWIMLKNLNVSFEKDFKRLILPLFVFVLTLSFITINLPTNISLPSEISLTNKATFDIALKTLRESTKNLLVGPGPSTFAYQYNLYRGVALNATDFWSTQFDQGSSVVLTFLTTLGIIGALAVLKILVVFFWQGLKKAYKGQMTDGVEMAVLVGGVYFLFCWFVYPFNLTLLFIGFLMLGLWTVFNSSSKQFSFAQSAQKAFLTMILGTILIVGSIINLYKFGQKYAAALDYTQGIKIINSLDQESEENRAAKLNEGIIKINQAVELDPKDIYFRNLSQSFLMQINYILNDSKTDKDQKQKLFQQAVSNAEISASAAVKINPKNSQNLLQLGSVYENFVLLNVTGAKDLAVLNYQSAQKLNPFSPLISFNLARVYFIDNQIDKAKEEIQKSLDLKADFAPALDLLGQIEAPTEE
jgi:hypothetical protein